MNKEKKMIEEVYSEVLQQAIKDGKVNINKDTRAALLFTDLSVALSKTTLKNLAILIEMKRVLGLQAELGKLGYLVEIANT